MPKLNFSGKEWRNMRGQKKKHTKLLPKTQAYPVGKCSYRNKNQFETAVDAHKHAKLVRKQSGAKVSEYKCKYCNYWHIGHNRPVSKRKPFGFQKRKPSNVKAPQELPSMSSN